MDIAKSKWRKSSRCDTNACLEVREHDGRVQIRDSKDPNGSVLSYTGNEWQDFLAGCKNGDFDL